MEMSVYNYICPPNVPTGTVTIHNHLVYNKGIRQNVHPEIAQANLSVYLNDKDEILGVRWIKTDGTYVDV